MVKIYILKKEGIKKPHYASDKAAGADVFAYIERPVIIEPGSSALIPTGLHVEIPDGYEIQVRPRSGLALKHQITVLNTPGTIDADYRGEIGIILINHGKAPFEVQPQMRIAQLVVAQVTSAEYHFAQELVTTARGACGFGHTGVN
jgi:dUTP pyrophosphatase